MKEVERALRTPIDRSERCACRSGPGPARPRSSRRRHAQRASALAPVTLFDSVARSSRPPRFDVASHQTTPGPGVEVTAVPQTVSGARDGQVDELAKVPFALRTVTCTSSGVFLLLVFAARQPYV